MLTIEQRLSNLENLVFKLADRINNEKFYTDADIDGNRSSISGNSVGIEQNTADIDYIMMMEDL